MQTRGIALSDTKASKPKEKRPAATCRPQPPLGRCLALDCCRTRARDDVGNQRLALALEPISKALELRWYLPWWVSSLANQNSNEGLQVQGLDLLPLFSTLRNSPLVRQAELYQATGEMRNPTLLG